MALLIFFQYISTMDGMRHVLYLLLLASADGWAHMPRWMAQDRLTSSFAFAVQATEQPGGSFLPTAIRVLERSTGAVIQDIAIEEAGDIGEDAGSLLRLVDANGDGRLDLSILMSQGGSGHIRMHNVYLFAPLQGKFVFHAGLSGLPNVAFAGGLIESSFRSANAFGGETYRFRGRRLERIAHGALVYSSDGKWQTATECKLAAGRMRCKRSRKALAPAHD